MQREITPEEIKLIQKVQLDLLKEVDRICKAEQISYGIDGGTFLGAVRHGGFIPWDPDIDVIMLRSEYEKFYQASLKYLNTEKYFLQEERTDPEYRWGHNKMRRKGTHLVRSGQEHLNMQDGIFIDILVMDNVPDCLIERKIFEFFCYCCRFVMWSEVGKFEEKKKIKRFFYKICNHISIRRVFKMLKKVRDHYNKKTTRLVRYMTCRYTYNKKLHGIEKRFFESYQDYIFEGMKFPAFSEYDEYLTVLYGNYMKLPPKEKRITYLPLSRLELIDEEMI